VLLRGFVKRCRDKELALQELHISNTNCASLTAERNRLKDRIVEMELEVNNAKPFSAFPTIHGAMLL
jgi:uncharacterized protein YdcH (DUF465 family)